MKKIIVGVICFLICINLTVPLIYAQSSVTLSTDKTVVSVEDTITLTVTFNSDAYMNALFYRVEYDSAVLSLASTSAEVYNITDSGIVYIFTGNASSVTETFTFKCVGEGQSYFRVYDIACANTEEYFIDEVKTGYTALSFPLGDTNGDNTVTTSDMALLKLFLSGQNIRINENSSDVNMDGQITTADLSLIKLYLAGQIKEFE
ncbi:MAG: dockerin type I domain-containing protein [Acutalibacteraceae bacterium]|nr:dockerin type I domain-containing protein [Acutalibacteraceae bacterium]